MENNNNNRPDIIKLTFIAGLGIIILIGSIYAAYRYSQSKSGNIMLPNGTTYLGPSPTKVVSEQPPTAPLRFTAPSDVAWLTYTGKIYPYSFSYPSTLPIVVFPGDGLDSVAIAWGNIPPQQNILLNMEFINSRDPALVGKPKIEFVKNWYKFFSGLKGLGKFESFTNVNALKGYKASFINYSGATPNIDVFIDIPNDNNLMVHLANGILDPVVFERILDSVKWKIK